MSEIRNIDPNRDRPPGSETGFSLAETVRRIQAGETDAFESLMNRFGPLVSAYFYARTFNHDEAEELFQETFIAAFRNISSLRDPGQFGPWLIQIAKTKRVDLIRKKKVNRDRIAEFADESATDSNRRSLRLLQSPSRHAETRELADLLSNAISRTGEKYRIILTLRLIEEYSPAEIADLLSLKGSAVRMRLKRGLTKLDKLLRSSGLELDLDRESD